MDKDLNRDAGSGMPARRRTEYGTLGGSVSDLQKSPGLPALAVPALGAARVLGNSWIHPVEPILLDPAKKRSIIVVDPPGERPAAVGVPVSLRCPEYLSGNDYGSV